MIAVANSFEDSRQDQLWMGAAALAALLACAVVFIETVAWHPGYAYGDETDIVSFLQRVREGMPYHWMLANGWIHKSLTLLSMSLWPGKLWAISMPALGGLALEAALLFAITRRLAGPRAAFLAVLLGLVSAFTLIRARVGLSFSLFPAEWLLLFWLRPQAQRSWQALLWGGAVAACCFDYEGWIPAAALLLALPRFEDGRFSWDQRGWELAGFVVLILALLPQEQLLQYMERRRAASFMNPGSPSAKLEGLRQIFFGGPCQPYMGPMGHAVFPLWLAALAALGAWVLGRRSAAFLPALGLGLMLPLLGGAPYGLPAHRFIVAWPMVVLLAGIGLDRAFVAAGKPALRRALGLALALLLAQQARAWVSVTDTTDARLRGPIRDLKRAADAAWEQSQALGLPLVTELHPLKGSQVRYLVGHPLPLPDPESPSVVVWMPWEYLPAVRDTPAPSLKFKEGPEYAAEIVAVLSGKQARLALEAERSMRPLLIEAPQFSLESAKRVRSWLEDNPKAGVWARSVALDYNTYVYWQNARLPLQWIERIEKEPLVSVRPLITAISALRGGDKERALALCRRATAIDPYDSRVLRMQRAILEDLGRSKEVERLDRSSQSLHDQGLLLSD